MFYVVYKNGNEDYVCTTDTIDFHNELKKNDVIVVSESEFQKILPNLDSEHDIVMVHVSLGQESTRMGLKRFSGKKVLFTIDECKSDGVLFRPHREFCEQINCKTMVLSYPSERNIKFLEKENYETIQYIPSNTVRKRQEKKYDIVISGQMDKKYYPTRVHLAETILKNKQRWNVIYLPHPGFEISKATHQYTGEKYRELLDQCVMGITCKAGWRDRLVAKYIELGASWCLPIGDVPSYMNEKMQSSMVVVDETTPENSIIQKIDEALENIDLRVTNYVSSLEENHNISKNVQILVKEIRNRPT